MARRILIVLLLSACTPAPAPAPGPTPAMIRFSARAIGPTALGDGAFVVDPGDPCPGERVLVVGAGLGPGEAAIEIRGGAEARTSGPTPVRPDGSFVLESTHVAGARELEARLGALSAVVPLRPCVVHTPVPGLAVQ